jgi:DNA-binding LacI/PurR family transcriptional regulator
MDDQPGMSWTQPFTPERALAVVDELVVRQRADAIVAVNDVYAARIVSALRRRGFRVPDDVAVIGCDDLELGTMIEPALTTIDLQVEGLSRAAVGLLFEMLDHGTVPDERRGVQIQPTLIVREST